MASEDLEAKVRELSELVHKQSEVLAQTGKQLLELQVKDIKSKMAAMEPQQKIDTDDFATDEDIVRLVCELQGQLDFLEDRMSKRVFNSHASEASSAKLAPVSNRDGEAPPMFPATLGELQKLPPLAIMQLCEFYELIDDYEPAEELEAIMKAETLSAEDAEKLFAQQPKLLMSLEEKVAQLTKEDEAELFDELARYIGVRVRKGTGW